MIETEQINLHSEVTPAVYRPGGWWWMLLTTLIFGCGFLVAEVAHGWNRSRVSIDRQTAVDHEATVGVGSRTGLSSSSLRYTGLSNVVGSADVKCAGENSQEAGTTTTWSGRATMSAGAHCTLTFPSTIERCVVIGEAATQVTYTIRGADLVISGAPTALYNCTPASSISIASVGQSGGVTAQTVNPSFTVQPYPYVPGSATPPLWPTTSEITFSISTRRSPSPGRVSIGVSVADDRARKWEESGRAGDYCEYFRSDLDQCITGWMRGVDSTAFFAL